MPKSTALLRCMVNVLVGECVVAGLSVVASLIDIDLSLAVLLIGSVVVTWRCIPDELLPQ